jgi:hypothetical protein
MSELEFQPVEEARAVTEQQKQISENAAQWHRDEYDRQKRGYAEEGFSGAGHGKA